MGDPAKKRATYEDLLGVPETLVAEILDGEIVTQPRPAPRPARVSFDPILKTPESYKLHDARWVFLGGWQADAMVRAEPFDAVELALGGLWGV